MENTFENQTNTLNGTKPERIKNQSNFTDIKTGLDNIFDKFSDGQDQINEVIKYLDGFIDSGLFNSQEIIDIRKTINTCPILDNKEQFINTWGEIIKPILALNDKYPEEFEKIQRKIFLENSGYLKIEGSEILSYDINDDTINIHLAPARTIGLREKINDVMIGFENLAKIVENDPKIKYIIGTSWIIAKNPKLLERFGFVTENVKQGSTKIKNKNKDKKVASATITRESFLKRYLKK